MYLQVDEFSLHNLHVVAGREGLTQILVGRRTLVQLNVNALRGLLKAFQLAQRWLDT